MSRKSRAGGRRGWPAATPWGDGEWPRSRIWELEEGQVGSLGELMFPRRHDSRRGRKAGTLAGFALPVTFLPLGSERIGGKGLG